MDQVEPSHEEGEGEDEVVFREDDLQPVETTPPTLSHQMTWMSL